MSYVNYRSQVTPGFLRYLLDLVRLPLLGRMPSMANWLVSGGVLMVLSALAVIAMRRYRHWVPFWL